MRHLAKLPEARRSLKKILRRVHNVGKIRVLVEPVSTQHSENTADAEYGRR